MARQSPRARQEPTGKPPTGKPQSAPPGTREPTPPKVASGGDDRLPPPPMRLGAPSPTSSFGRTLTSGASAAKEAVVGLCQRGRGLACQEGLAPPLWPHFDLNEPHRLFRHTLTSKAPGRGKRGGGPAPTGAASQATQAPRSSASLRRLTQAPSLGGAALPPKPQSLGWVKRRPPSLRLSAADSTWAQSPLSPLSGAVG